MMPMLRVCWLLLLLQCQSYASTMTGVPPVKNLARTHSKKNKLVSEPYYNIILGGGLAHLAQRLDRRGSRRVPLWGTRIVSQVADRLTKRFWPMLPVGWLLIFLPFQTNASTMTGALSVKNLALVHSKEQKIVSEPYDYIIAGGGLAACVLAERLTRDGSKRVLLLEAGRPDFENLMIRVPAGVMKLFRSVYDWQFESGGEKECHGRPLFFQRGKVLGGSSCTNLCLHFRGTAKDYDDWQVPGWTAKDVLPYFKKPQQDRTGRDPAMHGKSGEWVMDEVRYNNRMSQRFLEVAAAAGLGLNDDFNHWGRPQDGAGRFPKSNYNGQRVSGASAFLTKALPRSNLVVRSGVMCKKIDFDSTKSALGVTYDIVGDDSETTFQARLKSGGEVLVACGAIGSPQLLMCSGIGPARHLREFGIPVLVDNPNVGENLQDHPAATVSFSTPTKGASITSHLRVFGATNPLVVAKWFLTRSGPLTSTGCDHGAFVRTNPYAAQPDLQFRFVPGMAPMPNGMTAYVVLRDIHRPLPDGFTIQSVAIRAKSKGKVRLASSNSHVRPIIDAGYLSNPADLATLRNGIKIARMIGRRPEWKEYLGEEVFPGPDVKSDEQIDDYIRSTVHTSNALTGTCKMGVGRDAVVDSELRVLGVRGVRVVDSSIIPTIPGGQTGTPVVMIAERAAAMLLNRPEPTLEHFHQTSGSLVVA